jgi:hypothetical protein
MVSMARGSLGVRKTKSRSTSNAVLAVVASMIAGNATVPSLKEPRIFFAPGLGNLPS